MAETKTEQTCEQPKPAEDNKKDQEKDENLVKKHSLTEGLGDQSGENIYY